jgi:hypothetical protein
MSDPQFLTYFWKELSAEPLVSERAQLTTAADPHHPAPGVSDDTVP